MNDFTKKELANRWVSLLRMKAEYEHEERKKQHTVTSPSIDEICNEMIAYFTGIIS